MEIVRLLTYRTNHDDVDALKLMQQVVFIPKPLPPLNYAETELAKAGRKIPAIKAYRERVEHAEGWTPGLKDAKDLVETVPVDKLP